MIAIMETPTRETHPISERADEAAGGCPMRRAGAPASPCDRSAKLPKMLRHKSANFTGAAGG
jgi:hypothetical protein